MKPLVIPGDCLDVLRSLHPGQFDCIITDPPYGLADHKPAAVAAALTAWANGDREVVPAGRGFMGREWDSFVPPPAVWDECLRVLRPGGHLAVFSGARTVDLMGLSIRLAGFEVRDTISAWLYGSGMPKAKTVLKGAHEPILVARKPFRGSERGCRTEHGTGGLFVEACRVATSESTRRTNRAEIGYGGGNLAAVYETGSDAGRWPTNVVLAHHPDCGPGGAAPCAGGCHVAALDEQSGALTGGASRFFPTFRYQAKAPSTERPTIDGQGWPTVKPLGLMQWLARLLCPPHGVVLDPFAGTAATLHAAALEGFTAVGIERDPFAQQLAAVRLDALPASDPEPDAA